MLDMRHRINVDRHHIERIGPVQLSFDQGLDSLGGVDWWHLQEPNVLGPELLVDGDMEAGDTSAWTPQQSATLTKETGTRTGGSGTQVLRIARNGVNNPAARQIILTVGKRYRVTGWVRSDGNAEERLNDNLQNIFIGATSTDWQEIDTEFTALTTGLYIQAQTFTGTQYVEFDDVSVVELIPGNQGNAALATNKALAVGRDIVVNGDFTNWTTDDPDGWVVSGEVGADPEVSEVGSGESHGGVGTGACNFFSSVTDIQPRITQADSVEPGKTYAWEIVVSNITSGSIALFIGDLVTVETGTGTFSGEHTVGSGIHILIRPGAAPEDITIDSIVITQINIEASSEFPGPELLVDGDMEAVGVGDWSSSSATLTKETGTRTGGSGTQILRVARISGSSPQAFQTLSINNKRVRIKGWVRSDGNALPRVRGSGSTLFFTGTISTDWQYFDFEITPTVGGRVQLHADTSTGTEYTEWDDVSVTEAPPMNADNTAMAVAQAAGGNLGLRYLNDGATTYLDVESAEHNSKLDPTSFHVALWMQKTTWDTTERDILSYTVDANNWIRIVDTTTAGTLSFQFKAGGTLEEVTLATGSPTTDVIVGVSVDGGVMKAWYDTGQTGSDQAVAGTFVGNFADMLIGARTTTPTFVHLGAVSHVGTANGELSPTEWTNMKNGSGV